MVKPARRREIVGHLRSVYDASERRATGFNRSSLRNRSGCDPQTELRMRLKELATDKVRFGYRRLHVLPRRESWPVNAKRVLQALLRGRASDPFKDAEAGTRLASSVRTPEVVGVNKCRSMKFMSDALFDGRAFRILAVLDCHDQESLVRLCREPTSGPIRWSRCWTG